MIKVIGFDADDTLWEYEYIYHQTKPKITKILGDGYDYETLFHRIDQAEVGNISLYGYGIKSFALTMLEYVARLSPQPIDGEKLLNLIKMIQDMLEEEYPINPYAERTLGELSSKFELILITKGEGYEQERKIERSGLAGYFKAIEVVSYKTEATYRKVLEKNRIAPENFLMVGNSLKSDVLPVLNIGGSAVHIPHEIAWFHEDVSDDEREAATYYQLEHLGQLRELVEGLADGSEPNSFS